MTDHSCDQSSENPYVLLVQAVLRQAVLDAEGHTFAPGSQSRDQIRAEAQAWWADQTGPRCLVELCGYDADPLLRRVAALGGR